MIDVLDLDVNATDQMLEHAMGTALRGGDKRECPVAPSHPLWGEWQRAWNDQRRFIEASSGAMRYRTDLMKAEVARQTEHLRRPDPTAEILGLRKEYPLGRLGAASLHVNVRPFMEAMADAASACVEVFNRSFATLADTFDLEGLRVQLDGVDKGPDVQRLRHGSAATCPRHGRTKGGTCMKCVRRR